MPDWLIQVLVGGVTLPLIALTYANLAKRVDTFAKLSHERLSAIESKLATSDQAVLQQRMKVVELETVSFREFRHTEYTNRISQILLDMRTLQKSSESMEREVDALREWRHLVGDAYLPRGVDAIAERVTRLERKIFNGERHT